MSGRTPAIFPVDFVLREDVAVIIHSLYKAIAVWQSVPQLREKGLWSLLGWSHFSGKYSWQRQKTSQRVHKSGSEKNLWSAPNSELSVKAKLFKRRKQSCGCDQYSIPKQMFLKRDEFINSFDKNYFLLIVMEQLKDCKRLAKKKVKLRTRYSIRWWEMPSPASAAFSHGRLGGSIQKF